MKKCIRCHVEKPPTEFGKGRGACKQCISARQREKDRAATTPPKKHLEAWLAYGTPMERATVEAILRCGSVVAAAEEMQLSARALHSHLHELERSAAKRGWLPGDGPIESVPPGFSVKGTSTFYDGDGNVRGRWVKTKSDQEHALERLLAAMPHIVEPFRGYADPVTVPTAVDDDLLCVYPFGDPHLGMHAWHKESGDNFNLEIAERELITAVDHLVHLAPRAATAIIVPLGDTAHADGKASATTAGTRVDTDTRWSKVFSVIIRTLRRCVDRALEKHQHVHVKCVNGNHDDLTSMALALCLSNFYERDPRVTVDTSPASYFWYRFGKCLLGFTHGDKAKARDLPGIMACDRAEDWGQTLYRYWYCGHIHHETVKEYPGCVVESFRTLAPKDAWHAAQGYRSGQDMRMHVLHHEWGRINEHAVGIAQIRAARGESK